MLLDIVLYVPYFNSIGAIKIDLGIKGWSQSNTFVLSALLRFLVAIWPLFIAFFFKNVILIS